MSTYSGIALGSVAGGAPFSLTTVSGERKNPILCDTTTHKLDTNGHTASDIINTVSTFTDGPFALALPIGLPDDQKRAIRDANLLSFSHPTAFISLNDTQITSTEDGPLNILFIDTTPSQAAAEFSSSELDDDDWFVSPEKKTVLPAGVAASLSSQEIIDTLVIPTVPTSANLHRIAIIRPEGPYSELVEALRTKFPDAPIKWVTLSELSRGAALVIHRRPPTSANTELLGALVAPVSIGVVLADGQVTTVVQRNLFLPTSRTIALTTSVDGQTSATLQFRNGNAPAGTVILKGIAPRPKGEVRIQASVEIDHEGQTVVTVEELGGNAKEVVSLSSVLNVSREELNQFLAQLDREGAQGYSDGQEVGGLPA